MIDKKGYAFVEETKYHNLSQSAQKLGLPQPPYEIPLEESQQLINLPIPKKMKLVRFDLRSAIEARVTHRRYSEEPLTLVELSYLLWLTQGVKTINKERGVPQRTVPSAGSRHAFETYLSINRVKDLKPGLYRFVSTTHQLVPLQLETSFNERLTEVCINQRHVATSAVTFIWAAISERMTWRYCERGYRYLYLDAGHVCQNLYLAAESIGCGVCAIGAFDDDAADALLSFTPPEMFVIYLATLGKKF